MALTVQTREQERDTLPPLLTPDWPITNGLNNMQPIQACYSTNAIYRGVCVRFWKVGYNGEA